MDAAQTALLELGRSLRAADYRFITPTPLSHSRVAGRAQEVSTIADVFGWSRYVKPSFLPATVLSLLERAECVEREGAYIRSSVRFSTLGHLIFAHSRYPTDGSDSVFFGPDTYRFCREILALLAVDRAFRPPLIVDVGAGSGAGGIVAASHLGDEVILALTDINPKALRLCEVNAALNGTTAHCMQRDVLQGYRGEADFIIANPPYLIDQAKRAYRHGGGEWGCDLSLRILEEGLCHLSRGGKLLLYTGTPIVGGTDVFLEAAKPVLGTLCSSYRYEEVDVDVFGEELDRPPYDRADRLAAVALNVNGKDLL